MVSWFTQDRQLAQSTTVALKARSSCSTLCTWHLQVELLAGILQESEEPVDDTKREVEARNAHLFNERDL